MLYLIDSCDTDVKLDDGISVGLDDDDDDDDNNN